MNYYKVNSYQRSTDYLQVEVWKYGNIDDLEDGQPPNQFIHIELTAEKITYTSRYGKTLVISDDDREFIFEAIRDHFDASIENTQKMQEQFDGYTAKK
jgi:hypothetical protein